MDYIKSNCVIIFIVTIDNQILKYRHVDYVTFLNIFQFIFNKYYVSCDDFYFCVDTIIWKTLN
jgi:hypothetical protein